MKIPKTVKVGAHTYTIKEVDNLDGVMGMQENIKLKIQIDKDLPQSQKEETFFHECLHGILDISGINRDMGTTEEEKLVQAIGHGFYQLLIDNNLLK